MTSRSNTTLARIAEIQTRAIFEPESICDGEIREYAALIFGISDPLTRSAQMGTLLAAVAHMKTSSIVSLIDSAFELSGISSEPISFQSLPPVDAVGIAGSGKKGIKTVNISTAAALLACACGTPIAKATSQSTSSVTGSSDALTLLGIKIPSSLQASIELFNRTGFGIFSIEERLSEFDRLYGGLMLSPHSMSMALPALTLPVRPTSLVYGLAAPRHAASLEILEEKLDLPIVVTGSQPTHGIWIDEVLPGVSATVTSNTQIEFGDLLDTITELAPDLTAICSRSNAQGNRQWLLECLAGKLSDRSNLVVAANAALYITVGSRGRLPYLDALKVATASLEEGNPLSLVEVLRRESQNV